MNEFFKEIGRTLQRLMQTPAALSIMVAGVLVNCVLYPQPYLGELVQEMPIAVVDQDGTSLSREVIRRIDHSDSTQIVAHVQDVQAAEDMFYNRDIFGFVVVPQDFEKHLLLGRSSPIAAYGDGSYFVVYSAIRGAVQRAASGLGADISFSQLMARGMDQVSAKTLVQPFTVTNVRLFNPQGGYAAYVVPAAFVLFLQQTLLIGIGILHSGRSSSKGLSAFAEPITYIAIYLIWAVVTLLIMPQIYGFPMIGDPLTLFLVILPMLAAITAFGFAVAESIPSQEGLVFFFAVLGIPMFFLSGLAWPLEEIPQAVNAVALLIPSTSALTASVQINQMGADLSDVLGVVYTQLALTGFYSSVTYAMRWLKRKKKVAASSVDREAAQRV